MFVVSVFIEKKRIYPYKSFYNKIPKCEWGILPERPKFSWYKGEKKVIEYVCFLLSEENHKYSFFFLSFPSSLPHPGLRSAQPVQTEGWDWKGTIRDHSLTDCSLSLTLPFPFSSPPTPCLSSKRTSPRTCSNSFWYALSRLSSFSKLHVNHPAMRELEDGWEAGINSAL